MNGPYPIHHPLTRPVFMDWSKLRWAPLVAHLSLSCTTPDPHCTEWVLLESAIKLATPDAGIHPVPANGSVFSLRTYPTSSAPSEHLCTATRLTATTFVSARHCISSFEISGFEAPQLILAPASNTRSVEGCLNHRLTADADDGKPVLHVLTHPTLDLALLFVDEPAAQAGLGEYMSLAPSVPETGSILFVAGFGLTEHHTTGELRAIEATLLDVSPGSLTVQGLGGGACVGDSGGPLFSSDGDHQLIGVLSTGSASCWGKDYYVNLLAAKTWLEDHIES